MATPTLRQRRADPLLLRSMKRRAGGRDRGFTIIELLVVMAVIGLLAAIAIPSFSKAKNNAYDAAAVTDTRSAGIVAEGYFTSTGKFPTDSAALAASGWKLSNPNNEHYYAAPVGENGYAVGLYDDRTNTVYCYNSTNGGVKTMAGGGPPADNMASCAGTMKLTLAPFGALTAQSGTAYNQTITPVGGAVPYRFSIANAPAGMAMSASTGVLSGTPTAAGTQTFTVTVTDALGASATQTGTVTVASTAGPPMQALTNPSPTGLVSQTPFSVQLKVTGGTAPFTWSATSMPGFMSVNAAGLVTGATVATAATTYSPVFTVTDSTGATQSQTIPFAFSAAYVPHSGDVLVNQFRQSGPGGVDDSYVELEIATDNPYTGSPMAGYPLSGFRLVTGSGLTITLPANAPTLVYGRSYLITGPGYSLSGKSDLSVPSLGSGGFKLLPRAGGVVLDQVGYSGFSDGGPLRAISGTPTDQYGWMRIPTAGQYAYISPPKNTHDNASDFALVSVNGGVVGGAQSMVGTPSPIGTADSYQMSKDNLGSNLAAITQANSYTANNITNTDPANGYLSTTIRPGYTTEWRTVKIKNATTATLKNLKVKVSRIYETNGVDGSDIPNGAATVNVSAVNPVGPASVLSPTSTYSVSEGTYAPSVTVYNLSMDSPASPTVGGGLGTTYSFPSSVIIAPGATMFYQITTQYPTGGSTFNQNPFGAGWSLQQLSTN